jgi:hypothetical protein
VRGAWNYTLHPVAGAPSVSEGTADQRSSPARRRQEMLGKLNDERLTGMTSAELACLCAALAPLQAARAQQRYSEQREGRARRPPANYAPRRCSTIPPASCSPSSTSGRRVP